MTSAIATKGITTKAAQTYLREWMNCTAIIKVFQDETYLCFYAKRREEEGVIQRMYRIERFPTVHYFNVWSREIAEESDGWEWIDAIAVDSEVHQP